MTLERQQCVCHECDNQSYVNPVYLFIDTQSGNMCGMRRKGRGNGKLIAHEMWQLRVARHRCGVSVRELAAIYQMSPTTMYDLLQGKTYKHVPDPRRYPPGYVPRFSADGRRVLREGEPDA